MSNSIHALRGEYFCATSAETRALGRRLGACAEKGAFLALDGPLGAGKTELVKGLAEGLGCNEEPTSPTFTLAHEYAGGRLPLFHLDFYRLESEAEAATSGLEDYLGEGVLAVEWASKFPSLIPPGAWRVIFEIRDDGSRRVAIS